MTKSVAELIKCDDRFILSQRRVKYPKIWNLYKQHVASFWTVGEIDLSQDMRDYELLSSEEKYYIMNVLAFFAASDGVVIENLVCRFMAEIQIPEARAFYSFQCAMENIHSETYSVLIETFAENEHEIEELFMANSKIKTIKDKADWALKWIDSSDSLLQRIFAFALVEGIFFSGSFCAMFWLKKRGIMPGLTFSNELISRDEGLHCEMAYELYSMVNDRIDDKIVESMTRNAVDIEQAFISESIPVDLIGMNSKLMSQYIEYVADYTLQRMGHNKIYNVENPFDFMEMISLQGKTNFFERRVSEYQKSGVMNTDSNTFTLNADF